MVGRTGVRLLLALAALAATALMASGSVGADSLPTGQRVFHNNSLEPVYNAAKAGEIGFLMEPAGKMNASQKAWAPIYVVVYPRDSTVAQSTTFSCIHVAMGNDNCPSHGNAIAGLAMATEPGVYKTGTGGDNVAGHDHLFDFPGGDDFNIAWIPTVVLFKNKADANEHVLTDARIEQLKEAGKVDVIPLAAATFLCAVVPQRIWDMATPIPNG
jgi:hypothetical protein